MSHIGNDQYNEALREYLEENCISECNHQKDCPHIDRFDEMMEVEI